MLTGEVLRTYGLMAYRTVRGSDSLIPSKMPLMGTTGSIVNFFFY